MARRYVTRRNVIKERLHTQQGGLCHLCRQQLKLEDAELDHVIPVSLGGSDEAENIKLAHRFCNRSRRNSSVEAARARLASLDPPE